MPTVDRLPLGVPIWVDLMTPDLERARAFYGRLFGWDFQVGSPESGHYTMCRLQGRNVAGMGQMPGDSHFPPSWSVYFGVEDVDATAARIQEKGGKVVMAPMDVFGEGRMAFCADPTGAHFGLWQPMRHTGAGLVDEPGAMAWHEVNTRSGVKAGEFYSSVFGLTTQAMEGMAYWTLHRGEKAVGGVLQMDEKWPADVPPHWMTYFAVADTDAAVKRVGELGGKVMVPAVDSPYGRMSVVADPAGAMFTVIRLSEYAKAM